MTGTPFEICCGTILLTRRVDEVDEVLPRLSVLDEREVAVVIARSGLDGDVPRTHPQIAVRVDVSAGRVSQIEKDAFQKLVTNRGENRGGN